MAVTYTEVGSFVRIKYTGEDPRTVSSDVMVQNLVNDVWQDVVGYNSMSNDYAYTSAKEFARTLANTYKKA